MLAITAPLKHRLQSLDIFAGWDVRTGTEMTDRSALPALDMRMAGALVSAGAVDTISVSPEWVVTLAVRCSDHAATQLDSGFAAVVSALHGWMPGQHGGRGWSPMRLAQVKETLFSDPGIAGLEMTFTTTGRYSSACCNTN